MTHALIISAAKTIDQQGSMSHCLELEHELRRLHIPLHHLTIEPLRADWNAPESVDHFRSGCAPIEALERAHQLIASGTPAVLISGDDDIRSGYERGERLQRMAVYGPHYPLTQAYTDLAQRFVELQQGNQTLFKQVAAALFDNHQLSFRNALADRFESELMPGERWFRPITSLFRGVDCANPLVDFSGRLLLANRATADRLQIPLSERIELRAVATRRLPGDGPEYLQQIAEYEHLREAYNSCCDQGGVAFAEEFRRGNALLEVYTCYPVVPMAFLLASGLVDLLEQIPAFLEQHSITVTGGMNLARAPWNNPALNALITMHHRLLEGSEQYGMVQGNGGLGYRQGVALLARPD
ncbi:hypothetical protein [Motiliproteus sediminis]|uniref:hypothetical protein n=1 Tax=Motiliproteus sediminis TaxID=1468178 RepID=UPI001AEF9CFD|nr:hypothetical protein [Motiliproteus sediminis]